MKPLLTPSGQLINLDQTVCIQRETLYDTHTNPVGYGVKAVLTSGGTVELYHDIRRSVSVPLWDQNAWEQDTKTICDAIIHLIFDIDWDEQYRFTLSQSKIDNLIADLVYTKKISQARKVERQEQLRRG